MKIILTEEQYKLLLKEALTPQIQDEIENVLEDIFANPENYEGDTMISQSGFELPLSDFNNLIKRLEDGESIFDLQKNFPGELKGGYKLREKMVSIFKDYIPETNQPSEESTPQEYPLNSIGEKYKELIKNGTNWIYLGRLGDTEYSGWKLHVYTTTIDEIAYVAQEIMGIVKSYNAELKMASVVNLEAIANKPLQKGKGISVYIPYSVIKNNLHYKLFNDIQSATSNLKTAGAISGDKSLTSNITYRYELGKAPLPILLNDANGNFETGIKYSYYQANYTSNDGGSHNPANFNPDIFETNNYVASAQNALNAYQEYKKETLKENIFRKISDFFNPKKDSLEREKEIFTCQDCGNPDYKMYMVNDDVWQTFGTGRNTLCLTCLKRRMERAGRPLTKDDFLQYKKTPANLANKEVQNFLNS